MYTLKLGCMKHGDKSTCCIVSCRKCGWESMISHKLIYVICFVSPSILVVCFLCFISIMEFPHVLTVYAVAIFKRKFTGLADTGLPFEPEES